jgi:hypothetical protein
MTSKFCAICWTEASMFQQNDFVLKLKLVFFFVATQVRNQERQLLEEVISFRMLIYKRMQEYLLFFLIP